MDPTRTFDAPDGTADETYLDTVALLQEEVARLEAELRLRDEQDDAQPESVPVSTAGAEADRRVEELTALVDERDEAIALLFEQLSAVEEAQAARSAEWDQLHRWVEELEARFGDGADPTEDAGQARREAEALRDQLEIQRRGWDTQRHRLEQEIAGLNARLDHEAGSPPCSSTSQEGSAHVPALLTPSGPSPREAELEAEAEALRRALERAEARLQATESDLQSERLRHDQEMADLRSKQVTGKLSSADLSPNERVKALREHLRELHDKEDEERKQRQLSARISRLLGRSGARR